MPEAMPKSEAVRERMLERTWRREGLGLESIGLASKRVDRGGERGGTRALCWTLSCTMGFMARARSSCMVLRRGGWGEGEKEVGERFNVVLGSRWVLYEMYDSLGAYLR